MYVKLSLKLREILLGDSISKNSLCEEWLLLFVLDEFWKINDRSP